MYRLSKDIELTPELLQRVCLDHQSNRGAKASKLRNYYLGKHKILSKQTIDPTKPNNKLVNRFGQYITDMSVGYFVGTPISYSSANEEMMEELNMIFTYNDEQDENSEVAKDASITGAGYELLYVDETSNVRFKRIPTENAIIIYDDTLEEEMLYGIRYFHYLNPITQASGYTIDVYSSTDIKHYKADACMGGIVMTGKEPHPFKLVPFVEYKNNEEMEGDFEGVISLIDAYDKMESNTMDDFDYFSDAYLALLGGITLDPEAVMSMKEQKVMLMPPGTDAKFITKQVDFAYIDGEKNRLSDSIHMFAKCPNLTDEKFAGNVSGEAMKYKTLGMENAAAIKERKFKKGLQRRIELIFNILDLYGNKYSYMDIEITFTRNLPVNMSDELDNANKARGLLSEETIISQISFVDNAKLEIEKRDKEQESLGGLYEDERERILAEETKTNN